nr:IclR family transcriptional regulator C-terminal domain-containing protein [uncultured Pedobacter sp.]
MIQVINRSIDILEYVAEEINRPKLMGNIAQDLNLNTSTCANIIKTLVSRGLLKRAEDEKGYLIGTRLIEISNGSLGFSDLIDSANHLFADKSKTIDENCLIAVLKDDKRQIIFNRPSAQLIQATTPTEKTAYDSSTGRLLIAFLEEKDLQLYLKKYGLPNKNTWSQATSRIGFFEEIKKIRAQGYALIEDTVQVVGVATPIYKNEKVIASFSIYLPSFRFNEKVKAAMIAKASELSQLLSS